MSIPALGGEDTTMGCIPMDTTECTKGHNRGFAEELARGSRSSARRPEKASASADASAARRMRAVIRGAASSGAAALPALHSAAHGHLRGERQRHELVGWWADVREERAELLPDYNI
jgi:hypothetical protein